jgi:hypothetical protein
MAQVSNKDTGHVEITNDKELTMKKHACVEMYLSTFLN